MGGAGGDLLSWRCSLFVSRYHGGLRTAEGRQVGLGGREGRRTTGEEEEKPREAS